MLCLLQGIKKWSKQVKFHTNVISNEEAIQDKTHFYEPYKIDLKKKKNKDFCLFGVGNSVNSYTVYVKNST